MCAGAAVQARVDRVVFAAWDPKAGAAGSVRDVLRDARLNHRVEVIGGILEEEATIQLRGFFGSVRASSGASSPEDRQAAGTVRSRPRSWERGQSGSLPAPAAEPTPDRRTSAGTPGNAGATTSSAPVGPSTAAASPLTRATPSRRSSSAGGPGTRGEARMPSRRERTRAGGAPAGASAQAGASVPRAATASGEAVAPTGSTSPAGSTRPTAPAEPAAPGARPIPRPGSPTVPGGVSPLPTTGDAVASRPDAVSAEKSSPGARQPSSAPVPSRDDIATVPVRRRRRGDARH